MKDWTRIGDSGLGEAYQLDAKCEASTLYLRYSDARGTTLNIGIRQAEALARFILEGVGAPNAAGDG